MKGWTGSCVLMGQWLQGRRDENEKKKRKGDDINGSSILLIYTNTG